MLSNVKVVHAQPDTDVVILQGWQDSKMVLGFVETRHLDDYFPALGHITGKHANLLVDRNIDAFAAIMSEKFQSGHRRLHTRTEIAIGRVKSTNEPH